MFNSLRKKFEVVEKLVQNKVDIGFFPKQK